MRKPHIGRAERPLLPATASSKGLGCFRLGSEQSRAAARALIAARKHGESEDYWDRELDCTGLAERLQAARERIERGEAPAQWEAIEIPSGKENTARGRLAARMNAARARMRQYEAG